MVAAWLVVLAGGCGFFIDADQNELREPGANEIDGRPDAGTDGGDTVIANDFACPSAAQCENNVYNYCDDLGAVQGVECVLGCHEGEVRCRGLTVSNFLSSLWDVEAGDVTLAGDLVLDTDNCDLVPGAMMPFAQLQPGGPELCTVVARTFTLDEDSGLVVVGSRGLAIVALGDVILNGSIDMGALGVLPGAGAVARGGPRPGAAGANDAAEGALGHASGGGGGGLCGAGGNGGDDTVLGALSGGAGGEMIPLANSLVPLVGGSAGGAAGDANPSVAGAGGAGGGTFQVSALGKVFVLRRLVVTGGGGQGGRVDGPAFGAGGGGGSGGAVFIEAPSVSFGLTNRIQLAGGGGGAAAADGEPGAPGMDGRDADDGRANGGAGPVSGGAGGGGDAVAGGSGNDGDDSAPRGGGGGGGGGCLLVRTADGDVIGTINSDVSPSPGVRVVRGDPE